MKTPVWTLLAVALLATPPTSALAQDAAWQKTLAAGKAEGRVVAASATLSGPSAVAVMKEVQNQFGISLELFSGRMAVAQEKIQTEQKSKSYVTDVMDEGGMSIVLLKKSGALQNVTASLPSLKDKSKFLYPVAADANGEVLNILEIHILLCVNTNLVKPGEEPKSWKDLLDPKWKGKIFLTNPLYTTAPEEAMLALIKAKIGLDDAYFAKLYRNAQVGGTGGSSEAMDKLVRGEVAIAGFFAGDSAFKPMKSGAPIKPIDFKEGNVSKTMKWGMVRNAPDANAAKVYVNWLLSKEGQTFVTQATGLESVRNDVPSSMPVRLKGPSIRLTYDDLVAAEMRREKNYMANLVGVKR